MKAISKHTKADNIRISRIYFDLNILNFNDLRGRCSCGQGGGGDWGGGGGGMVRNGEEW